MSTTNERHGSSHDRTRTSRRSRIGRLFSSAGRPRRFEGIETLENRILLSGDDPDFMLPLTPAGSTQLMLDMNGQVFRDAEIDSTTDDDVFSFVAPADDFVTVWADTLNPAGGSVLDSRVEVYDENGVIVASGSDNDTVTSGFFSDGWAGFVAEATMRYYIRVMADPMMGPSATGAYVVRIDAQTEAVTVAPDGEASSSANIGIAGFDHVFRAMTLADPIFESVSTLYGSANDADFDARIEIFDATGQRLAFDSEAGRLSNAFEGVRTHADSLYFIRVRGDVFDPANQLSTGVVTAIADFAALDVPIDPVNRQVHAPNLTINPGVRPPDRAEAILDNVRDVSLFSFDSFGTGLHVITAVGLFDTPFVPLTTAAIHLYNSEGQELGFNTQGGIAELQVQLQADRTYYVVVEGFNHPAPTFGGPAIFGLFIEAHHTWTDGVSANKVDDHVDLPTGLDLEQPPEFGTPEYFDFMAQLMQSTPLVFGDPQLYVDPVTGLPIGDRAYFQQAVGRGRIQGLGDSDIFAFTVPIDLLGGYSGNDDNQGFAMYVGGAGNFTLQATDGPPNYDPLMEPFMGIWDAHRWWETGNATGNFDGAVHAMTVWDPDGNGPAPEELIVGGEFTTIGDVTVNHIASYRFNPLTQRYEWVDIGGTNGPVFALQVWDDNFAGGGGQGPDALYVGGDFTTVAFNTPFPVPASNLARFDGGWAGPDTGGTDGPVHALAVWDPIANMPTVMGQPQFGDPELAVGGDFNSPASNIYSIAWDSENDEFLNRSETMHMGPLGTNGPVYALHSYDPPDPPAPDPEELERLVIGGDFSSPANNIYSHHYIMEEVGMPPMTVITRITDPIAGGFSGPVYALEVWDFDGENGPLENWLAIGGDFVSASSNIVAWDGAALNPLGPGTNGPVHALHAVIDSEWDTTVGRFVEEQVLHVGGDFSLAGGGDANNVAKFLLDNFGFPVWQPLGAGSDGVVHSLQAFNDEIEDQWDRADRAASRIAFLLSPTAESMTNMFIRVFDTNFDLLYENDTIAPPFPDPAGSVDPAGAPGVNNAFVVPGVFGGETIFIQITSIGSTGRYELSATMDAVPPDGQGLISGFAEPTGAGDFPNATPIPIASTSSGDGRNFTTPTNSAYNGRFFTTYPSGFAVSQLHELAGIEHIMDVDLYQFRAPANGTADIRIITTQLMDQFVESITDLSDGSVDTEIIDKVYNSLLDAKITIYNNDFEVIATNDSNPAVRGAFESYPIGSFATGVGEQMDRWHTHRDPRVVVDILAGDTYFIEISSAQLDNYMLDPSTVDWISAMGSYELLIKTIPNLFPQANPNTGVPDDHPNILGTGSPPSFATVIPINETTGAGSLPGVIDNHQANLDDFDFFQFIAPAAGSAQITVTPSAGLALTLTVFDPQGIPQGSETGAPGAPVTITQPASQGDLFFVAVDGQGPTDGSYTLSVSGLPFSDDHAGREQFDEATELMIRDFLGTGAGSGSIEAPGDVDVFYFEALDFDFAQVSITSLSATLDPFVRIFEIQEDSVSNPTMAGNPIRLMIAWNDDAAGMPGRATTNFSVTPDRTGILSGNTYNRYYIVVSGADPEGDFGNYEVTVTVTPTDDHPDATEFDFASNIAVASATGFGTGEGDLEESGDSDLFQFVVPAGGVTLVTVTAVDSNVRPRISIFDANFDPVTDTASGMLFVEGPDALGSSATFVFDVVRGETFYVLVEGVSGGMVTDDTGTYTVDLDTPTADDHANRGEFNLATDIPLSGVTGDGASFGIIGKSRDDDLFFFESLIGDDYVLTINSDPGAINPVIEIFNEMQNSMTVAVDGGPGDEDGMRDGSVTVTVAANSEGEIYYLLVSSDPMGSSTTGDYTVMVDGAVPVVTPPPINDDHANSGNFSQATVINLSVRTGDGFDTGTIDPSGDTDLFTFTSLAAGRIFVQVITPTGSLLDAAVRIFDGPSASNLIRLDVEGIPGANASTEFSSLGAGEQFFIEVDGVAANQGAYTVRVDTSPETFFLYFPEGFVNDQISEFVSVANPNPFAVTYEITLHYEDPSLGSFVVTPAGGATIGAGARGGVTISNTQGVMSGVESDSPYAIEITANGPLGATLSHYDFGLSIGESFTEQTSDVWTLAAVSRRPGSVEDFVLFYNPNSTSATVTLTAFTSAGQVQLTQTVDGQSRGGWNINDTSILPPETFGVLVTSEAANMGDEHIGIVVSLSHFDIARQQGFAVLGNPFGGATEGVITNLAFSSENTPLVSIFNPNAGTVSVTLRGSYTRANLPDVVRVVDVAAGQVLHLDAAGLGITANQPLGLRFSAAAPVTVLASEGFSGDANASQAITEVGTSYFFGDAFINTEAAGSLYFETLSFYNPAASPVDITIDLFFPNGDVASLILNVAGDDFAAVNLHELGAILNRGGLQFFSIQVSAARPFAASLTHYDLFLGGGWGTAGAPLGLLNPISSIA